MKKIILILALSLSHFSFSAELTLNEKAERSSLSIRLANYATQPASVTEATLNTILEDIQKLGGLNLTEANDLPLVKNTLLTLLILDDVDNSRTGVAMVAICYHNHTELFKKAASSLKTTKKKQLNEILQMMKTLSTQGNG